MTLTAIGTENEEAFRPLLSGLSLSDFSYAFGVISDEKACGVALINKLGAAFMLDYLYIASSERRKGLGTALIKGVQRAFQIPIHVNYPEHSEELHAFFLALGFRLFRDGNAYTIPAQAFLSSEPFQKLISKTRKNRVMRISTLTDVEVDVLKRGMIAEDLDPSSMEDPILSPALSLVSINSATGHPTACILCEQEEAQITILYLVNFSHDPNQLVDIFRAFSDAVSRAGLTESALNYVAMDEKTELLVQKLTNSKDQAKLLCKEISAILLPEDHTDTTQEGFAWTNEKIRVEGTASDPMPDPSLVFLHRTVSKSQRTKRGLRFLGKANLQARMLKELYDFLAAWQDAPVSHEALLAFLHPAPDHVPDEEEQRRDEAMYRRFEKELSDKELSGTDLSRFHYKDDEEFVGKDFTARYAALRYFSDLSESDRFSAEDLSRIRELRSDYEYRAIIIQSPYYALLANRDPDKMSDEELRLRIKRTEHVALKGFLQELLNRRKEKEKKEE